jgi:Protein of unknown function (DUF2786)
MDNDLLSGITSKIEALFRKAASTEFPEERDAFHAKALSLMAKHRIERVNLDIETNEQPDEVCYGRIPGSYAPYHHHIIGAVASLYDCQTYYSPSGRPGDPARYVWVYGYAADRQRVLQMAGLFIQDAVARATQRRTGYSPNETIHYRKSFLAGYAVAIQERFREAKRLLDQEQAGWSTTGNALVLASRAQTVQDAFKAKVNLRKAPVSKQRMSAEGFRNGHVAGQSSNIGRSTVGTGIMGELG